MFVARKNTDLSSIPSKGLEGSGSLFRVLQPFKPFTDTPSIEDCIMTNRQVNNTYNVANVVKGSLGVKWKR